MHLLCNLDNALFVRKMCGMLHLLMLLFAFSPLSTIYKTAIKCVVHLLPLSVGQLPNACKKFLVSNVGLGPKAGKLGELTLDFSSHLVLTNDRVIYRVNLAESNISN